MSLSAVIQLHGIDGEVAPFSVSASLGEEAARRCGLQDGHIYRANSDMDHVKAFFTAAMQSVVVQRDKLVPPEGGATFEEIAAYNDAKRTFATAMTYLEAAQMFAVRGLHTKSNAGVK